MWVVIFLILPESFIRFTTLCFQLLFVSQKSKVSDRSICVKWQKLNVIFFFSLFDLYLVLAVGCKWLRHHRPCVGYRGTAQWVKRIQEAVCYCLSFRLHQAFLLEYFYCSCEYFLLLFHCPSHPPSPLSHTYSGPSYSATAAILEKKWGEFG